MENTFDSSLPLCAYEEKGYLDQDFKFFHIRNHEDLDLPYHYHDFHKLVLILSGKTKYYIEGREYELLPFDFVLVNRNFIHKPVVDEEAEEYDRIILYLNHDFLKENGLLNCFDKTKELGSHVVRFSSGLSSELFELFGKIEKDMVVEDTEFAGMLTTRIDVLRALIEFNKACINEDFGFKPEARYNRKVIEIIDYIMKNLDNDLSIDFLADHFYLSKYHMMRIFKNETGYSIHQYISEKRILRAKKLIMSGTPATVACLECGFRDYSTFSRAFKNQLGMLPSEVLSAF